MRETQQLFPVANGFANVIAPFTELPLAALEIYKALLIELARRDLLKRAKDTHVFLESDAVLDEEEALIGARLPEIAEQLFSVGLEYSLDVEPSGLAHTKLITSYDFTSLADDRAGAWQGYLSFPSRLLEHLALEVAQQRDWIEKNVFPATAGDDAPSARWAENLTIRCVPKGA